MENPAQWLDESGIPRHGAPMGALLSAHATRTPSAPAFTFGGKTLSFAQMDKASNRLARRLASAGVRRGDCVVISMPNRPEYVQAVYAAWKLGATPCPISQRLTPGELAHVLELAQPRLVVGAAGAQTGSWPLFDVDQPQGEANGAPLPPMVSSPGKILASGGSTGRPKLVVDPHSSEWGSDKVNSYRPPHSTVLNAGPLYHTAPFAFAIIALAEGSHVICMERFEAHEWLTLAEKYRVTVASLVPTMMSRIARLDPAVTEATDLSSFRFIMHSSAPCPQDVKRWWLDRVGAEVIWEVYGSTERLGSTLINGPDWLEHPGSVGRALPGDTIVIADMAGNPLPPGQIGEILFRRSVGVGINYRFIGSETRICGDLDGLGDMGWLDEDGYLYIADRRTDMILVGGVNIYPAEIEAALEQVPGVLCAAIIGLPDEDLGNRIHAIVELAQDVVRPTAADGLDFLKHGLDLLAPFKRPHSAEFTHERLRDDAGKVRRSTLRAERVGPT